MKAQLKLRQKENARAAFGYDTEGSLIEEFMNSSALEGMDSVKAEIAELLNTDFSGVTKNLDEIYNEFEYYGGKGRMDHGDARDTHGFFSFMDLEREVQRRMRKTQFETAKVIAERLRRGKNGTDVHTQTEEEESDPKRRLGETYNHTDFIYFKEQLEITRKELVVCEVRLKRAEEQNSKYLAEKNRLGDKQSQTSQELKEKNKELEETKVQSELFERKIKELEKREHALTQQI